MTFHGSTSNVQSTYDLFAATCAGLAHLHTLPLTQRAEAKQALHAYENAAIALFDTADAGLHSDFIWQAAISHSVRLVDHLGRTCRPAPGDAPHHDWRTMLKAASPDFLRALLRVGFRLDGGSDILFDRAMKKRGGEIRALLLDHPDAFPSGFGEIMHVLPRAKGENATFFAQLIAKLVSVRPDLAKQAYGVAARSHSKAMLLSLICLDVHPDKGEFIPDYVTKRTGQLSNHRRVQFEDWKNDLTQLLASPSQVDAVFNELFAQ